MERIKIAQEVENAIRYGKPVVALESTLIAQGLPYPKNVEVALEMEDAVRKSGAVPATIAILDGRIIVGLNKEEIEKLGNGSLKVLKVGESEIPFAMGLGLNASTTVSGTAYIASMCKIKVFATGGIGGVHRGVNETFDISQDIHTMSQCPIAIVSSGAKSILDIPKTLERLESSGVLTVGYKTGEFPAFYSYKSGLKLNFSVDSPEEIAKIMKAKIEMGFNSAVLVGNPVPKDMEIPADEINPVIELAVEKAKEEGIDGKQLTPYLLAKIAEVSKGRSMKANIALLVNNALVAGEIAVALSNALKNGENKKIGFNS